MIARPAQTLVALLTCSTLGSCSREPSSTPPTPSASVAAARSNAPVLAQPPMPAVTEREPDVPSEVPAAVPSAAPPALRGAHPSWLVDETVDLCPAGRATASRFGALLLTRNNELRLAPLGKLSSKSDAVRTPIQPLALAKDALELARGPSVLGTRAYWINARQLLTADLNERGPASPPRVLATDAQNGTRVAVPQGAAAPDQPAAVAYIAKGSDDPQVTVAKLWSEGAAPLLLTPQGAAASSVALSSTPTGLMAWSMEGRTGMSPVHARELRFQAGTFQLLEDRVVWVGGASQPFSELVALPAQHPATRLGPARALLATEQDVSHFGLLMLTLPSDPSAAADAEGQTSWSLYPNGIEPAPVATAQLCGRTVIARVKPQSAQGATPQELELVDADASDAGPPLIAAYAQRFFDISLATLPAGALLVTVADERTWATTVRCRSR